MGGLRPQVQGMNKKVMIPPLPINQIVNNVQNSHRGNSNLPSNRQALGKEEAKHKNSYRAPSSRRHGGISAQGPSGA